YTDAGPIPGAVEAIAELRRRHVSFRFVTNTTRRSRRGLVERLWGYGFEVDPAEVFTSVMAGVRLLRERGIVRVAPFVARDTLEDLSAFELLGGTSAAPAAAAAPPAAVVIGDLGDQWTPALLNQAFRCVLDGALLIALQKDRYWLGRTGLELDAGPYVAAIEYATGRASVVCGKPSAGFYLGALADLGVTTPGAAAMVGDDLWADVGGAQHAGLRGWLVRTGKFREDVLAQSGVKPDRILDSVVGLVRAA
ncbi:MAG: TIGR01458 family HAD-type hydrolase, partial [Gemmatimonadetes bacterium]|nr:TIGR01458 family HAD-type hydrolase [Gemmatimonadota bacterium]